MLVILMWFVFDMYDDHNRHMTVIGRSLGGGQIMITEVMVMICLLQAMSLLLLYSMKIDLGPSLW